MIITDRDGRELQINSMILKDIKDMRWDIEKALLGLDLQEILALVTVSGQQYSEEEKMQAVQRCITKALRDDTPSGSIDLEMAKAIMIGYLALGGLYNMNTKNIYCGTQITDRNGVEHTAYSYLLSEHDEVMSLLSQVDLLDSSNNTEESYSAMIEILYRALDRKITKEDIESFVDAEFARKVMRVYYDLPPLSQ